MTTVEQIEALKAQIMQQLPAAAQGEVRDAIATGIDWQGRDRDSWLQPVRKIEFFQQAGTQPEEISLPDEVYDKAQYPDGYWLHGEYVFPVVQCWEGILFIGYTWEYDCGETALGCFHDLPELLDRFGSLTRYRHFTENQLTVQSKASVASYLKWSRETGRDPYEMQEGMDRADRGEED